MSESMFIKAVGLARSGKKAEARRLLEQLLKADRTNEMAWLWYAECVDTPAERAQALEACIRINPQAQRVRLSLSALQSTGTLASDAGLTVPVYIGDEEARPAKAARTLTAEDRWVISPESNIFTVSPDHIPPEEFARVEEGTETFLLKNPDLKPVWQPVKTVLGPTVPVSAASLVNTRPVDKKYLSRKKHQRKTRGAVLTLLLVTLMFALLAGAVIILRVV